MDQAPQTTLPPQEKKGRSGIQNIIHIAFTIFVAVPAIFFWIGAGVLVSGILFLFSGSHEDSCSIARIPLHGVLAVTGDGFASLLGEQSFSSADSIVAEIQSADKDDAIRAILLDVDSPGGTPVAGDEVMRALQNAKKPVVAVVRDLGASAAYWAMAGADHIIASPASSVGSIGVTMSYTEQAGVTQKDGGRWIGIASGAYKDAGNPERPLTKEEQAYFQAQVDEVYAYMISEISDARTNVPKNVLKTLADGRIFTGSEALRLGLIDELGGFKEARTYLEKKLTLPTEDVTLCEASRLGSLF